VNKDHVLFLVIGLLGGFLLGYVGHEVMASRQPAPAHAASLNAGASPAPALGQAGGGQAGGGQAGGGQAGGGQAGGGPAGGAPGSGPAMEQVQQLRAYVEKNPNDAQAVRQLADLNYDINNWQRAAELYQHFLTLQPDDADVMTDLGACFRNMGKFPEALAVLQQAKAKSPQHWQARYNEVLVLGFDLGRTAEAAVAVAELKKLQPSNPEVNRLAEEVDRRRAAGG
jgi:predicted Zn-dependent protease